MNKSHSKLTVKGFNHIYELLKSFQYIGTPLRSINNALLIQTTWVDPVYVTLYENIVSLWLKWLLLIWIENTNLYLYKTS